MFHKLTQMLYEYPLPSGLRPAEIAASLPVEAPDLLGIIRSALLTEGNTDGIMNQKWAVLSVCGRIGAIHEIYCRNTGWIRQGKNRKVH